MFSMWRRRIASISKLRVVLDVVHQLGEVGLRPHVKVDRVVLRVQQLRGGARLLLGRRRASAYDQLRPLQVVGGAGTLRPLLVVVDHVLQRRPRPPEIERIALVGNRIEQRAAGAELVQVGLDRADRVLAVLEEVVGDDEVDRFGRDRLEPFAVVDHVDGRQLELGQFGIVLP